MKPNLLLASVAGMALLAACQTAPADDMSDNLTAEETIEVERVMEAEGSVEIAARRRSGPLRGAQSGCDTGILRH